MKNIMESASTLQERQAVTWAADVLAAKTFSNDINIVYYEDVVLDPVRALKSALESWGYSESIVDSKTIESVFGTPSTTAKGLTDFSSKSRTLNQWQDRLDHRMATKIIDICHEMGVDDYSLDVMPMNSICQT